MKRYGLFSFDSHYPSGGWNDFVGSYDTIAEAEAAVKDNFWHIIDLTTGEEVKEGVVSARPS